MTVLAINLSSIANSIIFSLIGIGLLMIFYYIIEKITPENTWHEISHNKNTALAIVFGAMILAIGMIISAAIHG